jgi:hypothetical protein
MQMHSTFGKTLHFSRFETRPDRPVCGREGKSFAAQASRRSPVVEGSPAAWCRRQCLQSAVLTGLHIATSLVVARAEEDDKLRGLPVMELKERIRKDFQENQYYVTGKLSPELYTDSCVFKDPTTEVLVYDLTAL